jgi:YegS C-terminal NAD kinase beta sandwich-like domain
MIRPGQPWGAPTTGPPDATGAGSDRDLATLADAHRGARLRFEPDERCELARAVGLTAAAPGITDLPVDALDVEDVGLAVNMVIAGVAPDRLRPWSRARPVTVRVDGRLVHDAPATTVVVANGQFRRGADVVPRGHPGDGRLEVQVYALRAGERTRMRRRLPGGGHLPHPRIVTTTGRQAEIRWAAPAPVEIDGTPGPRRASVDVAVRSPAFVLLV